MNFRLNLKRLYDSLYTGNNEVVYTSRGYELSFDGRYYDLKDAHTGMLLASDGEHTKGTLNEDGSATLETLGEQFILSKEEFDLVK